MRETTVRSFKGVISKLCKIESGFIVKRNLAKLDSGWGVVSDHTSWKLQLCYKPADLPNVTQSHSDFPELQHDQAPQTHPAPVSQPVSPLTTDAAGSSPFLGVTPGEAEEGIKTSNHPFVL